MRNTRLEFGVSHLYAACFKKKKKKKKDKLFGIKYVFRVSKVLF